MLPALLLLASWAWCGTALLQLRYNARRRSVHGLSFVACAVALLASVADLSVALAGDGVLAVALAFMQFAVDAAVVYQFWQYDRAGAWMPTAVSCTGLRSAAVETAALCAAPSFHVEATAGHVYRRLRFAALLAAAAVIAGVSVAELSWARVDLLLPLLWSVDALPQLYLNALLCSATGQSVHAVLLASVAAACDFAGLALTTPTSRLSDAPLVMLVTTCTCLVITLLNVVQVALLSLPTARERHHALPSLLRGRSKLALMLLPLLVLAAAAVLLVHELGTIAALMLPGAPLVGALPALVLTVLLVRKRAPTLAAVPEDEEAILPDTEEP